MYDMASLTSINYNAMEDKMDKHNRFSFNQQLADPSLGMGSDSLFGGPASMA